MSPASTEPGRCWGPYKGAQDLDSDTSLTMTTQPLALPLLLLLLLGAAAARPGPPRAPRHSDGLFTSELSRLRENAQLQRLLQGLVGRRRTHFDGVLGDSEPDTDTENSTSWPRPPEEPALLLWAHSPALLAWRPLRTQDLPRGPRSGLQEWVPVSEERARRRL